MTVSFISFLSKFLSFNNLRRLSCAQISDISPVGTIAFLHEEESLLVRIRNGWQYIAVIPFPRKKNLETFSFLKYIYLILLLL